MTYLWAVGNRRRINGARLCMCLFKNKRAPINNTYVGLLVLPERPQDQYGVIYAVTTMLHKFVRSNPHTAESVQWQIPLLIFRISVIRFNPIERSDRNK